MISVLSYPGEWSWLNNPIEYVVRSDRDDESLRIVMKLSVYVDGFWKHLAPLSHPVDGNGVARFDVSSVLEGFAPEHYLTWPESCDNFMIAHRAWVYFRCCVSEQFIDDVGVMCEADEFEIDQASCFALCGGVDDDLWGWLISNNLSLEALVKQQGGWLTNCPQEKVTHIDGVERLYGLHGSGYHSVDLWAKLYYEDGTEEEKRLQQCTIYGTRVIECCVSAGLVSDRDDLVRYDIWLKKGGTVLGSVRRFVVDRSDVERTDQFFFKNGLGGYDCVMSRGARKDEKSYERREWQQRGGVANSVLASRTGIALESGTNESCLGLVDDCTQEWLGELMSSGEVKVVDRGGLCGVVVVSDDHIGRDDMLDGMNEAVLKWRFGAKGRKRNLNVSLAPTRPLPPFVNDCVAMFDVVRGDRLISSSGLFRFEAKVSHEGIEFPYISYADVFNKHNGDYWNIEGVESTDRKWTWTELSGTFMVMSSTQECRGKLFVKEFVNKDCLRDGVPVLVYRRELNEEERAVVVRWMDAWVYLADNGDNLLKDIGGNFIKIRK